MMDISNKTLGLLLVAAIVVSVGGTLVSLNKLETVSPTGLATSDTGVVTLSIDQYISIIVDDDSIDFGLCTLEDSGLTLFNSSVAGGYNNSNCDGPAAAAVSNITIRNAGTLDAQLILNATVGGATANGGNLFDTVDSEWFYQIVPDAGTPCAGTLANSGNWYTITNGLGSTTNLPVCTNFTIASKNLGSDTSVLAFYFAADVGEGARNTNTLDLVFEGVAI
jgi:hypothetical protein